MTVEGLSHVVLRVSDMDRSIEFYRKYFGWEQLFDTVVDGPELAEAVGKENASVRTVGGLINYLRLELVSCSWTPQVPASEGLGLGCLTFQVSDAEAFHRELVAGGVQVSGEPQEIENCKLFFMWDPDGQKTEIVEYGPDAEAWGGRGKAKHWLL